MEYTKPVEEIIARISELMNNASNLYIESRNAPDWKYWEGKWSGLTDALKVAVEILAKVEKEVEK